MIVSELQRSEQPVEPPPAAPGVPSPDVPVGLSAALLRGIDAIVRYRTAARYAALYPAAMRTVAVNDGAHVTTAPHVSLHRALVGVLGDRHAWLLFDVESKEVKVLDVSAAQAILFKQAQLNQPS